MPRFQYKAREADGTIASGTLVVRDVNEAARTLRTDGKTIISLSEQTRQTGESSVQLPALGKRVPRDSVIFFASQLAVMVDTGVPLTDALDCIAVGTQHLGMRAVVEDLVTQVKGGTEFSKALENHPKIFSKLFVSLMRASEASGTMGTMLQRLSEYLEQDRDMRKQIQGAMTYPVCMLSFCILVVIGMLIFILPRFEKIYAGKGAVLPAPTRMLLGLSNLMVNHWAILLTAVAAGVVGLVFFMRSETGKIFIDKLRISVPIMGPMACKASLARSLRTMATMVTTGVSMLDGLNLTAEVSGNLFFARMWNELAERAKEGATLSEEMMTKPLIPPTVSQMIAAGERTGKLGPVMNRVAGFCEADLKIAIKTVTSMVEPIMIIVMGMIVGGIAMALLLPIFSVSKLVAH